MYCKQCGALNVDLATVCAKCAALLGAANPAGGPCPLGVRRRPLFEWSFPL
jgi:hypothetical protein